jgi:prepilin signal peptidase PulO-like enzyme (type II secretory pathway)
VGGFLILLRRVGSRSPIPFGPFLAAGAATALLVGTRLLDWYVDRVFL